MDCFHLKVTTRRCRECNYTHSQGIGCRPADSILQVNQNPQKRRENTKVTPGNMPSRECNVVQKPLARRKEVEIISEQPVPNAPRVEKEQSACVFCIEKGETQNDHHTSECHRWNEEELSNDRKWDILLRNRACLLCFDLGHASSKCTEKVRSCKNCQVTHGTILLCKSEDKAVEKDNTPDESSRENKTPEALASIRQAPTVPQPKGA